MAAGPRFVFGGNNTKIGTSRNIARWVDDHGEHTPPPAKWTSWPTITYFLPKSIEYYHHQLLIIGKFFCKVFSTIDFRCLGQCGSSRSSSLQGQNPGYKKFICSLF